jgi:menaquinone-dependent protoporphyrinogen IX oxidase
MKVVVLFESRTGNTREAARWVGGAASGSGAEVSVRSVRELDLDELAAADLAFIGTWVDGLVVVGHRPGGARHLKRHLPQLWDIPVAAFTTHAVNPGSAATKLGQLLANLGAHVVGAQSFHRRRLPDGIPEFVDEAMAAVGHVSPASS